MRIEHIFAIFKSVDIYERKVVIYDDVRTARIVSAME